ncbi:hypothetical protein [Mycobacterium sp.]|uniref:hypothetical protein n=1 Tax=Mycobacterium sp. TaxID=1785 RepID=UPI0025D470F2|nr:hypothetical protein [Mycobacterium sp.]
MSVPWSLTNVESARIDSTMGIANDHCSAVTAVLIAAQDAVDHAAAIAAPSACLELRAADELVALIHSGACEDGRPDFASTRALIQRIEWARHNSAPPY